MEGRGITNYSTSKPTHGYTTATTEFDDALLNRGIINFEQAMMAKGATYEEAKRLKELKQNENEKSNVVYNISNKDEHDNPNHKNDDDDDDFLRRYRKQRINELKKEKYGTVIPIQRNEWNHQVNEASQDGTWVIINLTAQKSSPNDYTIHPMHKDICTLIENDIIPVLAMKYKAVKFVSIPSTSAIENWPENNLPTLFCYRYGKLQHQLVGLGQFGVRSKSDGMNCEKVEYRLGRLGIIDTDIVEEDDTMHFDDRQSQKNRANTTTTNPGGQRYGRSHFGGVMSQLQTGADNNDESDYDDVD